MTEFLPPSPAHASKKTAPGSSGEHSREQPLTGGGNRSNQHSREHSGSGSRGRELAVNSGSCPACSVQWTLDEGDEAPTHCPRCNHELARPVYQCGRCKARWTLDEGDAPVQACPSPACGVSLHA